MATDVVCDLIPFVHVKNVPRSIAFYEKLGLVACDTFKPRGTIVWASLKAESARIMLAQSEQALDPDKQGVLFYLYSVDLAALRARLISAGLKAGEIEDGSPGPKQEMRLIDPDGYCLMIAQKE